ncbi:hypothetical protein WJX74_003733 [Apatococcus lobatus]|uniref:PHD-type domain-containing protein n=1 Tax=Apatococcus lobatus TaxID=904363 RepID=A0AAW1R0V4_9CHLO
MQAGGEAAGPRQKKKAMPLLEMLRKGLLQDGEVLRYKRHGKVHAVATVDVAQLCLRLPNGELIKGFSRFEDYAGSQAHRPCEFSLTLSGQKVQDIIQDFQQQTNPLPDLHQPLEASAWQERHCPTFQPPELPTDINDDCCHICGLQGDLFCCEGCPAVAHAVCLGLPMPPQGDWYCPLCTCSVCGSSSFGPFFEPPCQVAWMSVCTSWSTDAADKAKPEHVGEPPGMIDPAAEAAPAEAEGITTGTKLACADEPPETPLDTSAAASTGAQHFIRTSEDAEIPTGTLLSAAALSNNIPNAVLAVTTDSIRAEAVHPAAQITSCVADQYVSNEVSCQRSTPKPEGSMPVNHRTSSGLTDPDAPVSGIEAASSAADASADQQAAAQQSALPFDIPGLGSKISASVPPHTAADGTAAIAAAAVEGTGVHEGKTKFPSSASRVVPIERAVLAHENSASHLPAKSIARDQSAAVAAVNDPASGPRSSIINLSNITPAAELQASALQVQTPAEEPPALAAGVNSLTEANVIGPSSPLEQAQHRQIISTNGGVASKQQLAACKAEIHGQQDVSPAADTPGCLSTVAGSFKPVDPATVHADQRILCPVSGRSHHVGCLTPDAQAHLCGWASHNPQSFPDEPSHLLSLGATASQGGIKADGDISRGNGVVTVRPAGITQAYSQLPSKVAVAQDGCDDMQLQAQQEGPSGIGQLGSEPCMAFKHASSGSQQMGPPQEYGEAAGAGLATEPWAESAAAVRVGRDVAAIAARGLQPCSGPECKATSGLLRWQLICGAAVADPEACHGWAPKYSELERSQLRDLLWAVRQVLTESFSGGLPDVRVGGDLLPLLLQGWRAPPHSPADPAGAGRCNFSGFHTAVLLSGSSLVSVALVRALGEDAAEIPVVATRPQLRNRGLARRLLAALEEALKSAGVARIAMPAIRASGKQGGNSASESAGLGWGGRVGYGLLFMPESQALCSLPLLRFPGKPLLCKRLTASTMPQALADPQPNAPQPRAPVPDVQQAGGLVSDAPATATAPADKMLPFPRDPQPSSPRSPKSKSRTRVKPAKSIQEAASFDKPPAQDGPLSGRQQGSKKRKVKGNAGGKDKGHQVEGRAPPPDQSSIHVKDPAQPASGKLPQAAEPPKSEFAQKRKASAVGVSKQLRSADQPGSEGQSPPDGSESVPQAARPVGDAHVSQTRRVQLPGPNLTASRLLQMEKVGGQDPDDSLPLLQLANAQPTSLNTLARRPSANQNSPSGSAVLQVVPLSSPAILPASSPRRQGSASRLPRAASPPSRRLKLRRPGPSEADEKQPQMPSSPAEHLRAGSKRKAEALADGPAKNAHTAVKNKLLELAPGVMTVSPKQGPGRPKQVASSAHLSAAVSPRATGVIPDQQGFRARQQRSQGDQPAPTLARRSRTAPNLNTGDVPASPRKQSLRSCSTAGAANESSAPEMDQSPSLQQADTTSKAAVSWLSNRKSGAARGTRHGATPPSSPPAGVAPQADPRARQRGRTRVQEAERVSGRAAAALSDQQAASPPSSPSKGTHHSAAANARWERYRLARRQAGLPVSPTRLRKRPASAASPQNKADPDSAHSPADKRAHIRTDADMLKLEAHDVPKEGLLPEHHGNLPNSMRAEEAGGSLSSGPEDGEILSEAGADLPPPKLPLKGLLKVHASNTGWSHIDGDDEELQKGFYHRSRKDVKSQTTAEAAGGLVAQYDQPRKLTEQQAPWQGGMQQGAEIAEVATSALPRGAAPAAATAAGSKGLQGKKRSRELAQLLEPDARVTGAPAMVQQDGQDTSGMKPRRGLRGTRSGQ